MTAFFNWAETRDVPERGSASKSIADLILAKNSQNDKGCSRNPGVLFVHFSFPLRSRAGAGVEVVSRLDVRYGAANLLGAMRRSERWWMASSELE